MSDQHRRDDDLGDVEALLRSLDDDDRALTDPPEGVWASIEQRLATDAPVASLTEARARRSIWTTPLLAAAAIVAIVAAGVVVVTVGDGDDRGDTVVATARLDHATGFDALGEGLSVTAELVDDGTTIALDPDTLPEPAAGEDLELWLIQPTADGGVADLVSLGVIGDDGDFQVPDGYDPDVFAVVDISVEPRDGDASHSGRSIVRGALDA